MSQNNNIAPLLASLVVTVGLLGGGAWWFFRSQGGNVNQMISLPIPGDTGLTGDGGSSTPRVATFSQVKDVPSGLFNYGGSTTWAPIRLETESLIAGAWPEFRLRYTDPTTGTPGSGSGIRMLLSGQLAFAQSSRPLNDQELQAAQSRGVRLVAIPVAIDGIAFAVHPSLQIPGLAIPQLADIYTGKITNWSQVGGPNLAITPYSRRPEDGGTVEYFINEVLGKQNLGAKVQMVRDTTDGIRKVAANPGGIYYASAPEIVGQCTVSYLPVKSKSGAWIPPYQPPFVPANQCPGQRNQLNQAAFQSGEYPITRRLFVIIKQNGQQDQQAGEAYANLLLTDQGQAAIAKAGYVPLR